MKFMKTRREEPSPRHLFVRHFAFGDVLLTTPFFRMLAEEDPGVQVDLYSMVDSVYQGAPGFGSCHRLEHSPFEATGPYLRTFWFNYEFDRSLHILDGYSLSTGLVPKERTLSWSVSPEERQNVRSMLEGVKGPLVGFLPLCGTPQKSLSPAKTQRLIDEVRKRFAATVALFAEPRLEASGCLNLTGKFGSIRELAAMLAECDVFLTIDTGPFHIAQALGVPTVALFGCTLPELLATRPESLQAVRLEALPCLGCYHLAPKGEEVPPACRRGDQACLEFIPEAQVVEAVARAMERRGDEALAGRVAAYQSCRESRMSVHSGGPDEIAAPYRTRILRLSHEHQMMRRRRKGWKRIFRGGRK